jgi:2-iminobutanoate/2-iminopropanoate deaminase
MQFIFKSIIILWVTSTITWAANKPIFTAPEPTDSPYRKAGHLIFISSQVPINPITHVLVSSDARQQVRQVFDNVKEQVIESGATMNDVVKINVYMDDIDLIFPIVKEYIPDYFEVPYPSRTPVGGLSFGASSGFRVAIDAIVFIN